MSEETPLKREVNIIRATATITSSYFTNNSVRLDQIDVIIKNVAGTLTRLPNDPCNAQYNCIKPKPAVPVEDSVQPDHIICLEDGRKLKLLKRYLHTQYNLTPDGYRRRWGLPADYPMVAPNYAKQRSEVARRLGLGRRSDETETTDL